MTDLSDFQSWQSLAAEFRKAQPSSPIWYGIVDQAVGALLAVRIEQIAPPVYKPTEELAKSNPFIAGTDLSEAYEAGWRDGISASRGASPLSRPASNSEAK